MAKKINLDNLMNELGLEGEAEGRAADAAGKHRRHRVDEADEVFSPLPAMPSGQIQSGSRDLDPELLESVEADPAVPQKPQPANTSSVGSPLSDVWTPEDDEQADDSDLPALLHERGIDSDEVLASAANVIKQSPGRRIEDVLLEMGVDEVELLQVVAELNRLEFERINFADEDEPGFDGTMLNRLGLDF
ncbi:MAG: hypothetical protein ACF8NJ_10140, partial [Phycisphaerales bacterium JB038]